MGVSQVTIGTTWHGSNEGICQTHVKHDVQKFYNIKLKYINYKFILYLILYIMIYSDIY